MYSNFTKLETLVKQELQAAEGGHDYWHAWRVSNLAMHIACSEGGNLSIIKAASLIHDIADSKFTNGDEEIGKNLAQNLLQNCNYSPTEIEQIIYILSNISFKGGKQTPQNTTLEFKIVQDADRLDAMGAIGIARTFNYGGHKNRELYNPHFPPQEYANAQEYRNSQSPTLNHFYEKLLKLKDAMNTPTAKKIAEHRHAFMETYIQEFMNEWNIENLNQ